MNRFSILAGCLLVMVTGSVRAGQPTWFGYGGDAQHTANSSVGAQPLKIILWQTPVDLMPQYSGSDLLIHYGEPMATASNTIIVPVKTGATEGFSVQGIDGNNGSLKWTQASDFVLPPHGGVWIPSFPATLTPQNRLYFAGLGGTVYYIDNPDAAGATVTGQFAFYGLTTYQDNKAICDSNFFISSPLTSDASGNIFFSFISTDNTLGVASGIARVAPDGTGSFVTAKVAGGDPALIKPVYNCAPALSNDGSSVYVMVSNTTGLTGTGRLVMLDSTTLVPTASVVLKDPSGQLSYLPDDGTASPVVGPDGDVYQGVLENPFPGNHDRGWLLHFSSNLSAQKTTGAFGWDDTPSIVPASMVPSYIGTSTYLLATKYNNYAGIGIGLNVGDGLNKIAILDPNVTQTDAVTGYTVMQEVLTILGVTPDPEHSGSPGAVREWCINSAVVDPATKSIYAGSEDGKLYQWDLTTNTFSNVVTLTPGIGEAYTPTLIGPNGIVYAINNATLFAVGSSPVITNGPPPAQTTIGRPYAFTYTAIGVPAPGFNVSSGALPDGLALDGLSGAISGTTTATGTFSGIVKASNTSGNDDQPFTITVNPLPSLAPATAPVGTAGVLYNFVAQVINGTKPYASVTVSGFDAGTTGLASPSVSSATGNVTFNSTPAAAGLVRLTVNATDAAGATLSQPLTIVINPAAFSIPAGKVGVPFSQALPAIDALPAGTYSFALANGSTVPPGLQLSGSGTISGMPTGSGGFSFVIKATDSASIGGPFVYSLFCSVTIAAPTLTITPNVPGGNVATPYSQLLVATGGTAPYSFAVTAGTLPPGLALTTAGLLSGIPTTEGDYKFTATAVDSTTGGGPYSISNDYEIVVDYVPVLSSNPIAFSQLVPGLSINSLVTNLTAVFSAVVSPSDAVISWDFGDSSPTVTGSTALHSYAAAGSFTVTVSAKNPRTASTTTATLTVDVSEGGALTGSEKLLVRSGTIALSSKINLIVLSESIPLGQNEKIAGATLAVSVNGVTQTFVLNATGQSKSATAKAHLAFKSKKGTIAAQTATLSVKILGATIPTGLKSGVDLNASGDPTKALLQTVFNGRTMTSITALSFKKTRHSNIAHFSSR